MAVSDYSDLTSAAESQNGLPPGLMSAVLTQESGGNPNAISPAGAQGVAQLMPATAADLGVDPMNPAQAIPAAAGYLRQQYDRFGDWGHALAAYNAGPTRVARSLRETGDIPAATQPYVSGVVDNMVRSPGAPPASAASDDDDALSPGDLAAVAHSGAYATDAATAAQGPDLSPSSSEGIGGGPRGLGGAPGGSSGASGGIPDQDTPPLPGLVRDPRDANVWRKADGSIGYLGPGGSSATMNADGSAEIDITGSSNPDYIASYLKSHPEMASPPQPPESDELTPDEMRAALSAGYSLSPGGPMTSGGGSGPGAGYTATAGSSGGTDAFGGGDPGTPSDPLGRLLRSADTTMRGLANGMTFGLADKAAAADEALPALFRGGLPAFQKAYSAGMDRQQQRNAADARDVPGALVPSRIAGGFVPASLLPEVEAPSWLGRAAVGAGQGALLGGADAGLSARGNLSDMAQASVPGMIWGGALGAPLGAAFGARAAAEAPAHLASLADYASAGVDPMLAVNGGRSLQQIGQVIKGTPIVGAPLAAAAERTQGQVRAAVDRIADRYGAASNIEEAGAPVMRANQASADAVQAQRDQVASGLQALAAKYGSGSGRRATGEAVQDAVTAFARGGDTVLPGAASSPARATSFADKSAALYSDAFGRLDGEMKGGVRATGIEPSAGPVPPSDGSPAGTSSGSLRDQALNLIRKGRSVRPNTGPSLMDFIAQNGGLHDRGGEVSAMDGDLWHRDLSHAGSSPFRRKIIQPGGSGLEEMAQKAADAGYFPDVQRPAWSGADNMQGVNSQHLLDAMRGELAGNKRYADFNPTASELHGHVQDAQELIDHLGLDPKRQSNAEMKAAMDAFLSGRQTAAGKPMVAAISPPGSAATIRPTATKAVLEDILGRAQSPAVKGLLDAPQVKTIAGAVNSPEQLSFQDLRGLRTWVRQAQRNDELRQTIGSADLQRLEGALTSDIYDNASRLASPAAAKQLRRADQFYAAGQQRISGALRAYFKAPSGEKAFDGIVSAAQTGSQADVRRLTGLKRSLQPQDWNAVASSVIGYLGEEAHGFDLDTFVRNYGKLSPEGVDALFGGRNANLQRSLGGLVGKAQEAVSATPTVHFGDTPASAMEGLLRASGKRGSGVNIEAVKALRSAIPDRQWGDVAAGTLRTLGRKGDGFSPDQFLTAWSKLSPEARQTIFGGEGHENDPASIESLVRVMQQQHAAGKFYNHSQSGHAAVGVLLMEHLGDMLAGKVGKEEAIHMGLTLGGGWGAGKLLASPRAARLLLRGVRAQTPDQARAVAGQMAAYSIRNPQVGGMMEALRSGWMQRLERLRSTGAVAAGVGSGAEARRHLLAAPQ